MSEKDPTTYTETIYLQGARAEADLKKADTVMKKYGFKPEEYDYWHQPSATGENDLFYVRSIRIDPEIKPHLVNALRNLYKVAESSLINSFDAVITERKQVIQESLEDKLKKSIYSCAELLQKLDLKFQTDLQDAMDDLRDNIEKPAGEAIMTMDQFGELQEEYDDIDNYIGKLSSALNSFTDKLTMINEPGENND